MTRSLTPAQQSAQQSAPLATKRPLALRFVLQGSRLIEASAGTGKTFTISALYLRLVLGHGGEAAFHRELLPPEILVVTFTEAATRELRDRIRARLVEAARVFRGKCQVTRYCKNLKLTLTRRSGPPVLSASTLPPSGWMRRRCPLSTAGVSACCASMPLTVAACLPKPCKRITVS